MNPSCFLNCMQIVVVMSWGAFGPIVWCRLLDFPQYLFSKLLSGLAYMWCLWNLISKWWLSLAPFFFWKAFANVCPHDLLKETLRGARALMWTWISSQNRSRGTFTVTWFSMFWTISVSHTMLWGLLWSERKWWWIWDHGGWTRWRICYKPVFCLHTSQTKPKNQCWNLIPSSCIYNYCTV